MNQKDKIEIFKERNVRTYAEMWHTSYVLLQNGLDERKGSDHQFMASIVFTAFTFEAYLNHIGPKVFNCWESLERLSPKDKLNVICEKIDFEINYGNRPWQIMKNLFGFRNDIAHGKSKQISETIKIDKNQISDATFSEWSMTEWEKYATRENAIRAREDVERMVRELHKAAGITDEGAFIRGMQFSGT